MTTIDSLRSLLEEELRDLYDAEKQLIKALPKLAKKALRRPTCRRPSTSTWSKPKGMSSASSRRLTDSGCRPGQKAAKECAT